MIFVDLVKEVYDAHVLLSKVEKTDGVDIEDGFRVKVFLQFVLVNGEGMVKYDVELWPEHLHLSDHRLEFRIDDNVL